MKNRKNNDGRYQARYRQHVDTKLVKERQLNECLVVEKAPRTKGGTGAPSILKVEQMSIVSSTACNE
jgi:tRNA A-37 threonylcarbamoyl transferase component Bud32